MICWFQKQCSKLSIMSRFFIMVCKCKTSILYIENLRISQYRLQKDNSKMFTSCAFSKSSHYNCIWTTESYSERSKCLNCCILKKFYLISFCTQCKPSEAPALVNCSIVKTSWNHSLCSSLISPKFSGKKSKLGQKVDLQRNLAAFVVIQLLQHQYLTLICFLFLKNPFTIAPKDHQTCKQAIQNLSVYCQKLYHSQFLYFVVQQKFFLSITDLWSITL